METKVESIIFSFNSKKDFSNKIIFQNFNDIVYRWKFRTAGRLQKFFIAKLLWGYPHDSLSLELSPKRDSKVSAESGLLTRNSGYYFRKYPLAPFADISSSLTTFPEDEVLKKNYETIVVRCKVCFKTNVQFTR